ncbi:MAG: hydrogenase maturation protease [Bacteroidetes bacterium]|nr:hydrogenase maturation protease [Bacteroidota bacterium]MCW5894952.1 hydrogenase maturation protease [Bacteroidota bacterium]
MIHAHRKVVVGIGEIITGDRGLGKHALRLLKQRHPSRDDIEFIEAGIDFDFRSILEESSHLLILDAADIGRIPGTIIELAGHDITLFGGFRLLAHQHDLLDLFEDVHQKGTLPEYLHFIGMQPNHYTPGFSLSKEVCLAMPAYLHSAGVVLRAWPSLHETLHT